MLNSASFILVESLLTWCLHPYYKGANQLDTDVALFRLSGSKNLLQLLCKLLLQQLQPHGLFKTKDSGSEARRVVQGGEGG